VASSRGKKRCKDDVIQILKDQSLRIFFRKKLYFHGNPSRVVMKRLREEFARCRESGFAHDIGEVTPGVTVISAPVFGLREKLIGCVGLIGAYPKSEIDEYGAKVASVAKQISHKMGACPGSVLPTEAKQKKIEKANKRNVLRVSGGKSDAVLAE
jgi:hypothetical protein